MLVNPLFIHRLNLQQALYATREKYTRPHFHWSTNGTTGNNHISKGLHIYMYNFWLSLGCHVSEKHDIGLFETG